LYQAQIGLLHPEAKPLRRFGSAGVVEVVEDFRGDTYRAVYTVRFAGAVFVLHCSQKKSKRGIETPQADLYMIRRRLKQAEAMVEGAAR
jgi:phage-related protein